MPDAACMIARKSLTTDQRLCICSSRDWRTKASASPNRPKKQAGQRGPAHPKTSASRNSQPRVQGAPRPAAQRGGRQPPPTGPIRAHGHPQGPSRGLHSGGKTSPWKPAASKPHGRGGRCQATTATRGGSPRNALRSEAGVLPPRSPELTCGQRCPRCRASAAVHHIQASCLHATDTHAAAGASDVRRGPGRDFVREHRDCILSYPRTLEDLEQARVAREGFFDFDWGEAVQAELDGVDADVGLPYSIAYQLTWLAPVNPVDI